MQNLPITVRSIISLSARCGVMAVLGAYWLAVNLAPLLHDHGDDLDGDGLVSNSHDGDHHGSGPHGRESHPHRGDANHSHSRDAYSNSHAHSGPHRHCPGTPFEDENCDACRFLALKPAPAEPVVAAGLCEVLPEVAAEAAPFACGVVLPLPFSRAPPVSSEPAVCDVAGAVFSTAPPDCTFFRDRLRCDHVDFSVGPRQQGGCARNFAGCPCASGRVNSAQTDAAAPIYGAGRPCEC